MFPDPPWAGVPIGTLTWGVNTPPGSPVNDPEEGASIGGLIGASNLSRALFGTTLSDFSHLGLYVYQEDAPHEDCAQAGDF